MYRKPASEKYQYNNPDASELKRILAPGQTALIMIDMQNDFIDDKGKFALGGRDSSKVKAIVPACKKLLEAARKANVFVVHIQQTTLPNEQSDSGGWLAFKTRDGKSPTYASVHSWGWEIVDELKPIETEEYYEPRVFKFRPDAFLNTPLDSLLHANGIKSVICCGCTTEGCVLATVMGAAFHDYYTCVAEDAVATSVDGAHEHALWLMKKRYIVRSCKEIIECWK
jgi:ureidoacrylate peracid hydrolase